MAEAIEQLRIEFDFAEKKGRYYWTLASIAAQMSTNEEGDDDLEQGSLYLERLLEKIQILLKYSDSDFESLLIIFHLANQKLSHLLRYSFDSEGIIILPKEERQDCNPARFRAIKCVTETSTRLAE